MLTLVAQYSPVAKTLFVLVGFSVVTGIFYRNPGGDRKTLGRVNDYMEGLPLVDYTGSPRPMVDQIL